MSAAITFSSVGFSWPDGTPVLDGLDLLVGSGRSGLVGTNGAGKSTLLRLAAGALTPTAGRVTVTGEAGSVEQADFDAIGDDWDVAHRAEAELARLGLPPEVLGRTMGELSGGEVTQLGLTRLLLRRPDVLLLDEPTKNLDAAARERLYDVVEAWTRTLVVVSHDRELLERVDRVGDLRDGGVRWYGGGYSSYAAQVAAEQEAAEHAVTSARSDVRRQRHDVLEAERVLAQRRRVAARAERSTGLGKAQIN
jgi:ATPase subunit of ABC transporter with duplicated ATPase domains